MAITAPFPYFGGKAKIAKWVASNLPRRSMLIDLFGGSMIVTLTAVDLRLFSGFIYNDVNDEVVEFFRVLRERPDELIEAISLTPYSQTEYLRAIALPEPDCELERARRFFVRATQAFRGQGLERGKTWDMSVGRNNARIFANREARLEQLVPALRQVSIANDNALDLIRKYDSPDVCFYADPPYHGATSHYAHSFGERDHVALCNALREADGAVAVSGYPSPLYEGLYKGFQRIERERRCHTAVTMGVKDSKRMEVLWVRD